MILLRIQQRRAGPKDPFAASILFFNGLLGASSVVMEPDAKACWSYVPTKLDPAEIIDRRCVSLITAACTGLLAVRG